MSLLGAASGWGLLKGGGGKGGLPLIIGLCGGLTPCIVLDILKIQQANGYDILSYSNKIYSSATKHIDIDQFLLYTFWVVQGVLA